MKTHLHGQAQGLFGKERVPMVGYCLTKSGRGYEAWRRLKGFPPTEAYREASGMKSKREK